MTTIKQLFTVPAGAFFHLTIKLINSILSVFLSVAMPFYPIARPRYSGEVIGRAALADIVETTL